jgi:hypothetical protein
MVVLLEKKMAWDTPKEAITMYWCVVLGVLVCRFGEDEDARTEIDFFEED